MTEKFQRNTSEMKCEIQAKIGYTLCKRLHTLTSSDTDSWNKFSLQQSSLLDLCKRCHNLWWIVSMFLFGGAVRLLLRFGLQVAGSNWEMLNHRSLCWSESQCNKITDRATQSNSNSKIE